MTVKAEDSMLMKLVEISERDEKEKLLTQSNTMSRLILAGDSYVESDLYSDQRLLL